MLQDTINVFHIEQSGLDKKVVHLKGADPVVFRREGDDTLHFAKKIIPLKIVPSIRSSVVCAS